MLGIFKPKSATDGAKESPVLMDSSSGGGARGDADVVATRTVSRNEGGAGAGSDADVVATGVVNGLEDCEGAGIDMGGVLSDAADTSDPADRTLVHVPIYRGDYVQMSGSLFSTTTHPLFLALATRRCRGRLG